jgi:hypothetical protein
MESNDGILGTVDCEGQRQKARGGGLGVEAQGQSGLAARDNLPDRHCPALHTGEKDGFFDTSKI